LAIVVESEPDHLLRALDQNPHVERLVRNRWVWLACIDTESGVLSELRAGGFVAYTPEQALPIVVGDSATWYRGKIGFLPPVAIVPGPLTGEPVAQVGPPA
jgi:hypothetical protein